jgi:hypothetical protein
MPLPSSAGKKGENIYSTIHMPEIARSTPPNRIYVSTLFNLKINEDPSSET